jgi:hypothetical protein
MKSKIKKKKVKQDAIATLPMKYVVAILVVAFGGVLWLNSALPRNVPPAHPTVTAYRWSVPLPTMTQIPSQTPIPIIRSATPYSPILDMMTQPNVEYFIMTELEIAYRGPGKVLNVKDIPGMYYPGTINPSETIGTLKPYSKWYIEQTYQSGSDVWARLASQETYIPLLYNGIYYTNWRPTSP